MGGAGTGAGETSLASTGGAAITAASTIGGWAGISTGDVSEREASGAGAGAVRRLRTPPRRPRPPRRLRRRGAAPVLIGVSGDGLEFVSSLADIGDIKPRSLPEKQSQSVHT